jgi:hypothetical protein
MHLFAISKYQPTAIYYCIQYNGPVSLYIYKSKPEKKLSTSTETAFKQYLGVLVMVVCQLPLCS